MVLRKCLVCKKRFSAYPGEKRSHCSTVCGNISAAKKRIGNVWNIGKKHSQESSEKKRLAMIGRHANEKNPSWKGNKVGYMGLHNWVRRKLGTPERCDGKNCTRKSKRYHWANRSGAYKRDLHDWIRLCVSCHAKLDWSRAEKWELKARRRKQMLGNTFAAKRK